MTRRMSTRIWTSLHRLLPQPLVGAGTVALALLALAAAWITAPMRIGGPGTVRVTLLALGLVSVNGTVVATASASGQSRQMLWTNFSG